MSTVILVVGCVVAGAAILVTALGWLMAPPEIDLDELDPEQVDQEGRTHV